MTPPSLVLPPATPSEIVSYIIAHCRYPTTLVVGFPKDVFLQGLITDVKSQMVSLDAAQESSAQNDMAQSREHQHAPHTPPPTQHPLARGSLLQTAVSRHIRMIFLPTVTHLRACLSVFAASDSRVSPPPVPQATTRPPLLIVYGFLEIHRNLAEWSAQGLSTSLAILVQGAHREGFQAAVMEPRGAGGWEELDEFMSEAVPILNGAARKDDGLWSGKTVEVGRVLGRWCQLHKKKDETEEQR